MNQNSEPEEQSPTSNSGYPPKPVLVAKAPNSATRSLIALSLYGFFMYLLFGQNLVAVACVLLVMIVHELGHFLLMRRIGYYNARIFILPLFPPYRQQRTTALSQRQLVAVILAGPAPGILIGTVLYLLDLESTHEALPVLAQVFLLFNVFNLLPLHPLDGGRLLEALFFRDTYTIRLVFTIISLVVLLFAVVLTKFWLLLLLPLFMVMQLISETKHQKIREYLKQEKIQFRVDYEDLPDRDYWLMRDCIILSFPKKYSSIPAGKYEYSIFEPVLIQQVRSLLQENLREDLKLIPKMLILVLYVLLCLSPLFLFIILKP